MNDDDERMELYAKHFSQCTQIDDEQSFGSVANSDEATAARLEAEIEQSAASRPAKKRAVGPNSAVDVLTDAIGIDDSTSKLFTISSPSLLAKTIRRACLKNELRFQCAFGFLNDIDKIREHINFMKQNDGNFKVMLNSECKSLEQSTEDGINPQTSVYSCVNQNAPELLERCLTSIEMYNRTRHEINDKIQNQFLDTLGTIEAHVDQVIADRSSEEMQRYLKKGELLIAKTLAELVNVEAFKCRQYAFMESCLLAEVKAKCSANAADSLRTILRVGYLERERGADLHQQFLEAGVPEHRACARFTTHEN